MAQSPIQTLAAPSAAEAVPKHGAEEREAGGGNDAAADAVEDVHSLEAVEVDVQSEQSAADQAREEERKAQRRRLVLNC